MLMPHHGDILLPSGHMQRTGSIRKQQGRMTVHAMNLIQSMLWPDQSTEYTHTQSPDKYAKVTAAVAQVLPLIASALHLHLQVCVQALMMFGLSMGHSRRCEHCHELWCLVMLRTSTSPVLTYRSRLFFTPNRKQTPLIAGFCDSVINGIDSVFHNCVLKCFICVAMVH